MPKTQTTVMVVVMTGERDRVKGASMEAYDALAQIRGDDLGVLVRTFDVVTDHGKIEEI